MRLAWLLAAALYGYADGIPESLACTMLGECKAFVRDGDGALVAVEKKDGFCVERVSNGAPQPEWASCPASGGTVQAMVRDRSGMLVLGGSSEDGATLWRFDPATRKLVAKSPLSMLGSYVFALAVDAGGDLFAGGHSQGHGFVARIDQTQLLPMWSVAVEAPPRSMAVTSTGNVAVIAGDTTVVQLSDADGRVEWSKTVTDMYTRALTGGAGGSVWVTGNATGLPTAVTPDAWQPAPSGTAYARYDFGLWFGRLEGLETRNVSAIAVHPRDRYLMWVGTSNGVFRSDNNGWTWESRSVGLPGTAAVAGLLMDPQPPYALTALPALPALAYRSNDEGRTWKELTLPVEAGRVNALVVNPATPETMHAGGQGVWRSTDGGTTWARLATQNVVGLSTDPDHPERVNAVYGFQAAGFPISISGGGVLHSEDGGSTWTDTSLYSPAIRLLHDPADRQRTWVLTIGGLWRSDDFGRTWTDVHPPSTFSAIAATPGVLYALWTSGNVYRTSDAGATFERVAPGGWILNARALAVSDGDVLQVGGGGPGDAVLRRYSAAGDLEYSTLLGRDAGTYGTAVEMRSDGGVTVGGQIWGAADNDTGIRYTTFVAYADASGQVKAWVQPAQ